VTSQGCQWENSVHQRATRHVSQRGMKAGHESWPWSNNAASVGRRGLKGNRDAHG
jgi:hypothetical protein